MVTSIMLTQNMMTEGQLYDMFSRWDQAVANGEVPAIEKHQWYGSLHLSVVDGITVIVAPLEEYDDNGIIEFIKWVYIPA